MSEPAERQQPDIGMRVLGFVLLGCGVLVLGRVATGNAGGDWRSVVLWTGMGIPLLLGGLLLNGWFVKLCGTLAWTLPATILFAGLVLMVDPAYASVLDGPKNQVDTGWRARGFDILFLLLGATGCAGWAYVAKKSLNRRKS